MNPVTQQWLHALPMMQQTVVLIALRGPDGQPKYSPTKKLLRWFRRCVLLSAMDGTVLTNPCDRNGGSFTGPSLAPDQADSWEKGMDEIADDYLRELDSLPHHFQTHLMHAAQVLGYKHPDERTRAWWGQFYVRVVNDLHLHPESEAEMDDRLGDSRSGWLRRADPATVA